MNDGIGQGGGAGDGGGRGAGEGARRTIDLADLGSARAYFFMISAIVPRPIAWISTRGADGSTNLAPFSFFQGVCAAPPTIMVAIQSRKKNGEIKDTLRNLRETGELVVNVVAHELGETMVGTSAEHAYGESEIDLARLATFPGERVQVPCLLDSPVNMECRVSQEVAIGGCVAVFAEILLVHAREDVLDARGVVDAEKLRPWARLGGSLYLPFSRAVRLG